METCPKCGEASPYRLADGRLKCRSCATRFSATSVWDSVRLPPEVTERLLDMVLRATPSNRPELRTVSTAPSRERFRRLALACCAYKQDLREPFEAIDQRELTSVVGNRGEPRAEQSPGMMIAFRIRDRRGKIQVAWTASRSWARIAARASLPEPGSLRRVEGSEAYVWLPVRGDRVVLRKERRRLPRSAEADEIERFWTYFRKRLEPFPWVHRKHFHLYLGEACYWFNRRWPLQRRRSALMRLMKKLSKAQIEAVLGETS